MPPKTLIKEMMGASPFPIFFLFLVLFFFSNSDIFLNRFLFKHLFISYTYFVQFTVVLNDHKKAEAGSVEVQPARNIFGYLSIYPCCFKAAFVFKASCIFLVSFIL